MMALGKKKFLETTMLLFFLVTLAGMESINFSKAYQTFEDFTKAPPTLKILSPSSISVYSNGIPLTFVLGNIQAFERNEWSIGWFWGITGYSYSLDGQNTVPIAGNTTLTGLQNGTHTITINATCMVVTGPFPKYIPISSNTITFTVDTKPPKISLLLQNRTYNQLSLPLDVLIDQPTSWIGYSLDNEANVTIKGNTTTLNLTVGGTTLSGLTVGTHNLTVYANDSAGNMGKSDAVFFTVALPTPSPSPTQQPTLEPTQSATPPPHSIPIASPDYPLIIGIVVATVIAIGLGVSIYKRTRDPT